jgi:hypothetical protein
MPLPLQIVFHQLDRWPGAEAVLRERAQRLERLCPEMMSCRVVVEETQKHQQLGRPVAVQVEVHVPGHALTRRLEDLTRRRREQGREHGAPRTGQVLADSQERAEAQRPQKDDTQPAQAPA